jgi:hypothetical protein
MATTEGSTISEVWALPLLVSTQTYSLSNLKTSFLLLSACSRKTQKKEGSSTPADMIFRLTMRRNSRLHAVSSEARVPT